MVKNFLLVLIGWLMSVGVYGQDWVVTDSQNSGCMNMSRSQAQQQSIPTIILEKEGSTLSVQLLNYGSNCGTSDFVVKTLMTDGGNDAEGTLEVVVTAVANALTDCYCPFNVTFTVNDVMTNNFTLKCWWFEGTVELQDGEPLVLEDVTEVVTIGDQKYKLRKALHKAMLSDANSCVGELHIPSELTYDGQTYAVVSLASNAFIRNSSLTRVYIPRTLSMIDFNEWNWQTANPFYSCKALEWIEVEEVNPVMSSTDGILYSKDKKVLLSFPVAAPHTTFTISDEVEYVGTAAFANNKNLEKVVGTSQNYVGNAAFGWCQSLEEVVLPSGIEALPLRLFMKCGQLKSVQMPVGVNRLGSEVFMGCSNLTEVSIPDGVKTIESEAFSGCKSLQRIVIPSGVERIMYSTFSGCTSLKEVIIPDGVKEIGNLVFSDCTSLPTLDVPESVTVIAGGAIPAAGLNTLYIRGLIEPRFISEKMFQDTNVHAKIYVQPSEVEKYKSYFGELVYPLASSQTVHISDVIVPSSSTPSVLYDLQGRRVIGEPAHGVYIFNGRKILY